jgi:hypothetical protein
LRKASESSCWVRSPATARGESGAMVGVARTQAPGACPRRGGRGGRGDDVERWTCCGCRRRTETACSAARPSTAPRPCSPPARLLPRLRRPWIGPPSPSPAASPSPALVCGPYATVRGRPSAGRGGGGGWASYGGVALENAFEQRGMANLHSLSPPMQFASRLCMVY